MLGTTGLVPVKEFGASADPAEELINGLTGTSSTRGNRVKKVARGAAATDLSRAIDRHPHNGSGAMQLAQRCDASGGSAAVAVVGG